MTQVMFYVQHLLGIGHVRRAALLARGMAARGSTSASSSAAGRCRR